MAPHDYRRIVAVVLHHICDIFLPPFIEYRTVTVGAFWMEAPVVKRFNHKHDTHLVTKLDEFGSRHVVGSAHSVHAHILKHF